MLKLTRSASEGERFPTLVIVGVLERSPSLALFEVAQFAVQPGGFKAISRWSPKAHHRFAEENVSHPGGMPLRNVLASLRDAATSIFACRWYRFAQPPANGCKPSGLNCKSATSKSEASANQIQESSRLGAIALAGASDEGA